MDRFAYVLKSELVKKGHSVQVLKPKPIFGKIFSSAKSINKWLGYIDRFLLFFPLAKKTSAWADIVHICDQANAIYIPWFRKVPHIITCHDMLAIRSALNQIYEKKTRITGKIYQRWILTGLKKSQHVACVSLSTYNDLLRTTKIAKDKISVVQNGLNYPFRPMKRKEASRVLNHFGLFSDETFFLHVGGNFWYKNKEGLLRIYYNINRLHSNQQQKLILISDDWPRNLKYLAKKLGITSQILTIPYVTEKQLCALYSLAEGLILPSFAEGFGWPIIEAQACGCPVFTSNRPPMNEVGGKAAVYFDPSNTKRAAEIISKMLKKKTSLKKEGIANAKKYSTEKMIKKYLDCYRTVIP